MVTSSNPLKIMVGQFRQTLPVDFVPGWTAAVLFATGELKSRQFHSDTRAELMDLNLLLKGFMLIY
jgi:hypothetical protein